jgi:hypothetical protein
MATRTQEAYIRAVYELAKHYHKGPDQLGDEELKSYLYYCRGVFKTGILCS